MSEELVALAQRLIGYETAEPEGISEAAGFVKGWLEARGIEAERDQVRGLPVIRAEVGPATAPTVVLEGHIDVVPAHADQFEPRLEGDRLYGRGAYDMKGALAAMMIVTAALRDQDRGPCPPRRRRRRGVRGEQRARLRPSRRQRLPRRLRDHRRADRSAHRGRGEGGPGAAPGGGGRAAHGATPWLGDNAVLNAIDVFRSIESLPFARHSSELFDRPSINLGRIWGGDALNKVPDRCVIDVDIRYLPDQDPTAILAEVRGLAGCEATSLLTRPPATVDRESAFVRALRDSAAEHHHGEPMSVGRDGASDAVSFLRVGVPAVEFGPVGAGHHGPEEWVSISSLEVYRQALESFLRAIPGRLGDD